MGQEYDIVSSEIAFKYRRLSYNPIKAPANSVNDRVALVCLTASASPPSAAEPAVRVLNHQIQDKVLLKRPHCTLVMLYSHADVKAGA